MLLLENLPKICFIELGLGIVCVHVWDSLPWLWVAIIRRWVTAGLFRVGTREPSLGRRQSLQTTRFTPPYWLMGKEGQKHMVSMRTIHYQWMFCRPRHPPGPRVRASQSASNIRCADHPARLGGSGRPADGGKKDLEEPSHATFF